MHISARTDYALRALLALAAAEAPTVPGPVLAAEQRLPLKFLEAILADLRRAGGRAFTHAGAVPDGARPLVRLHDGDWTATIDGAADPGDRMIVLDLKRMSRWRHLDAAVDAWGLRVLEPSAAQNQNGLAVARATAERLDLEVTSDLRGAAAELTIGGPPECPDRPYCLPGLAEVYGLTFAEFRPLADQAHVRQALADRVIDVGVLFTTDGALAGGDLVLLGDDRGLQPAENLVPMVRAEVLAAPDGDRVAATLDAVSGHLTTANLRFLNWRVSVAGNDPADEAHAWLVRQGLVER